MYNSSMFSVEGLGMFKYNGKDRVGKVIEVAAMWIRMETVDGFRTFRYENMGK